MALPGTTSNSVSNQKLVFPTQSGPGVNDTPLDAAPNPRSAQPIPYYDLAKDTRHAFDQVGNRQLLFQSANEARHWHDANRKRPAITADQDPTINQVEKYHRHWVLRMVNAVYDLDNCKDGQKMKNHFNPGHKSYVSDIQVEAACHLLVEFLIKNCRDGFPGLDKNNLRIQKKCQDGDKTANCCTHAENIVKALRAWKSICKSIVEEDGKKWQLVNAPLSVIEKRVTESKGNEQKKAANAAGKEARLKLSEMKRAAEATATPDHLISPSTPQRQLGPPTPTATSNPVKRLSPNVYVSSSQPSQAKNFDMSPHHAQTPNWQPEQASLGSPFHSDYQFKTCKSHTEFQEKTTQDDGGSVFADGDLLATYSSGLMPTLNSSFEPTKISTAPLTPNADHPAFSTTRLSSSTAPQLAASCAPFTTNTPPPAYGYQQPMLTDSYVAAHAGLYGFPVPDHMSSGVPSAINAVWDQMPPSPEFSASNTGSGHVQNSSGYYNYNHTMPHYDHYNYYNYGTFQHAPSPFTASPAGTTSSLNTAQPYNASSFSNDGEATPLPNDVHASDQAAQTLQSVQLPQPMIHSNHPKIGTKRDREESKSLEYLPPSRRQKRNVEGEYWSNDKMTHGDGDDE
ncbi:hypothetical protein BDU57DRAFT_536493 [Ampelomyces quisqualis]|uniref:Uncharacterized protein n=1 Tax=Ampelomyces quisqualis TaxID=50730 RepID=A0A6A5QX42_AMPQU|nr:hypothetical protein BDU57DRAFT_536493 [Ampelomyces quisqualis]